MLIVMDLDGTLLNEEGRITEYTKKILKKVSEDNILIAASGRGLSGIKIALEDVYPYFSYYICGNGSFIYHENELIYEKLLSEKDIELISELAKELNTDFRVMNYDKCETLKSEEDTLVEAKKNNLPIVKTNSFSEGYKMVISGQKEKMDKIMSKLEQLNIKEISHCRSDYNNIDFGAKGISKAEALRYICDKYNYSYKDTIAFGDAGNDAEMLCFAEIGVAMKNAMTELKEYATYVTQLTNDEDGVAHFLAYMFNIL